MQGNIIFPLIRLSKHAFCSLCHEDTEVHSASGSKSVFPFAEGHGKSIRKLCIGLNFYTTADRLSTSLRSIAIDPFNRTVTHRAQTQRTINSVHRTSIPLDAKASFENSFPLFGRICWGKTVRNLCCYVPWIPTRLNLRTEKPPTLCQTKNSW